MLPLIVGAAKAFAVTKVVDAIGSAIKGIKSNDGDPSMNKLEQNQAEQDFQKYLEKAEKRSDVAEVFTKVAGKKEEADSQFPAWLTGADEKPKPKFAPTTPKDAEGGFKDVGKPYDKPVPNQGGGGGIIGERGVDTVRYEDKNFTFSPEKSDDDIFGAAEKTFEKAADNSGNILKLEKFEDKNAELFHEIDARIENGEISKAQGDEMKKELAENFEKISDFAESNAGPKNVAGKMKEYENSLQAFDEKLNKIGENGQKLENLENKNAELFHEIDSRVESGEMTKAEGNFAKKELAEAFKDVKEFAESGAGPKNVAGKLETYENKLQEYDTKLNKIGEMEEQKDNAINDLKKDVVFGGGADSKAVTDAAKGQIERMEAVDHKATMAALEFD